MKLSDDHIAATYWLAERYRTVTVKKLTEIYEQHESSLGGMPDSFPFTIAMYYTQPENQCVLCKTKDKSDPNLQGCCCINTIDENGCFFQETYRALTKTKSLKEMVTAMHNRSKHLYALLDKYHKQEDTNV